jgi:hypothetical protein
LQHVNDEIKLRKFAALQKARERGEDVDELAALKTARGIRNWHLMVPNWSEGTFMSGKGRRKHERQLEREVREWQSKEESVGGAPVACFGHGGERLSSPRASGAS